MALKFVDVYSGSGVAMAGDSVADGILVKLSQGTQYVNPIGSQQYALAKSKGKLLGAYHYAGGEDAVAEANHFYSLFKKYSGEAVPGIDWESNMNSAFGKDFHWVRRFVDRIHDLSGVWCIIYVQASAIAQVADCVNDCPLWVAGYPTNADTWAVPGFIYNIAPWKTYTLWQFTSAAGKQDRSIAAVSAAGWKKIANPSGSSKPAPAPTSAPQPTGYSTTGKSINTMVQDVIAGRVSTGDARKKALGVFYDGVQAVINYNAKALSLANTISVLKKATLAGSYGNGTDRKTRLGTWYNAVQNGINSATKAPVKPAARYYTVKSGDNLSGIGKKLGIAWTTLAKNNGIKAPAYVIYPGQKIKY